MHALGIALIRQFLSSDLIGVDPSSDQDQRRKSAAVHLASIRRCIHRIMMLVHRIELRKKISAFSSENL
jgi:hypothetical protein